ncbi:hypothetical protein SVAN01_04405 [Stagonosporopsis vannaccii]|nr:hypothetical protein SVAN01_04405 [Stagonosporopsis vannaccii]
MSLNRLPPIITGLHSVLQDSYMRASGNPSRRMNIIQEHAQRFTLTDADYQALAVEEVRCAYQNGLPQGEYRNGQGDMFTVDEWGKPSTISKSEPPEPNSIWIPKCHRRSTGPVPAGYHFILGSWGFGNPTPPPSSFLPCRASTVPVGLEGARYLGPMPPMPQHLQSCSYMPRVPTDAVSGGRGFYLATTTPVQQPATTILQAEVNSDDLGRPPHRFFAGLDRVEEPVQGTLLKHTEEPLLDCAYPGYAPAQGFRGTLQ